MERTEIMSQKMKPDYFHSVMGNKLAFYEKPGHQETVLFIHGHPVWSDYFHHQMNSPVFKEFQLVFFDFPGCGNSQSSENPSEVYTYKGLSELVGEVLVIINKPVWIIGHSFGSNLALELASRYPHLVKGLFLSGTSFPEAPAENAPPQAPPPEILLLFQKMLSVENCATIAEFAVQDKTLESYRHVYEGLQITDSDFRLNVLSCFNNPEISKEQLDFLSKTNIPVALLEGEKDFLTDLPFKKNLHFRTLWRNQCQIVASAGHYLHADYPEEVNHMFKSFYNDVIK